MKKKVKERMVFMNGKFVPESKAQISIYDSALMFGDMVFEMTRSFNKKHFKLEKHIDRLFTGLKILRIEIPYSKKDLVDICKKTSKINENVLAADDEHRLMIDVTRGALGIYSDVKNIQREANVIVADFPLRWTVNGMGELFNKGINAVITSQRAIPSRYLDPKIKNRSRLFYLMANIEASLIKGDNNWAILLDDDGFITEGTGDNFFIVKNNVLITPEPRNILVGISRDYVIELAKELKIKVIEKNIEPYDVYTADEAFMTGTPFCMLPVKSLNEIKIGNKFPGKIYKRILKHWSKKVKLNIKSQIIGWNKNQNQLKKISPYRFK